MDCTQRSARPLMQVVALIALVATGSLAAADLYKWTDANGVVHYSDTPPANDRSSATRVHVGVSEGTPPDVAAASKPPADAANKPAAPAQPESLPDTPENRKRLCDQAQAQLDLLKSKFPVGDSTGKPLDDKSRAEHTAQAQQVASSYCGG